MSYIKPEYVQSVKDEISKLMKINNEKGIDKAYQNVKNILKDITMVSFDLFIIYFYAC